MNAWTKRCVAVFLLSFLATAYSASFNVDVKANFITPCTGSTNYNPGAYGCTLSPTSQNFNSNPVNIKWGKGAIDPNLQSGLSFFAYSGLTLGDTSGTAKAIGQLTHTNYPLDCMGQCDKYTPTDFSFALQVMVNVPGQVNPVPFVGEYSIKMDETVNVDQRTATNTCPIATGEQSWTDAGGWNTALPCCPYYSTAVQPAVPFSKGGPCSDRLVVTKTYTSNSFPYNGVSYTLMILGFSSSSSTYNPINPSFTSQENQQSVAYIWAYIRQTCTAGGCNDGKACTTDSCGSDGLCVNTPTNLGGGCTDAWNYDASATCTSFKCVASGTCLGSNKPNGQTCTTTAPLPSGKTSDCMVTKCNTGVCQWQQKNDATLCTTTNAGQLYALGSWADCNSIGCRSGVCTFSTAIGQTCNSISVKTCNAAKCKATSQFGATVARCTGSAVYPLQTGSCTEGTQTECKRRTCVSNGPTLGTCGKVNNDAQGSCQGAGVRSCQKRTCSGGACTYVNNQPQGSCSQSFDGSTVGAVFCNKRLCNNAGTCKLSYDNKAIGSCTGLTWKQCFKRVCYNAGKTPPGSCGYVANTGGSCTSSLAYKFCNTRKCNSAGSCRYEANAAEPGSCTTAFPPRDCWKRSCKSTAKYPPGSCGPQPNDAQGSCLVISLANQGGCTLGYPYASSNPRTSQTFAENTCLRAFDGGTSLTDTIRVYYADEHPLTLGVRHTGWNFTEWNSPFGGAYIPGAAYYPYVGDLTVTDPAGRPIYPALFITDITDDANSHAGDWQWYGTPVTPHAVFGSWKGGDYTGPSSLPTLDGDKIYSKPGTVGWGNLGPSADTPPNNPTLNPANEYWVTEIRWNVWELQVGGQPLQVGRSYRVQFMVHDGDLNSGDGAGDAGEACINIKVMGAYPCNKRVCKSGSCGYAYLAGSCASLKNWSECKKRVCKDTGINNFLPGSCAYFADTQQNGGSCYSLPVQECRKRNCNSAGTCASNANQAQGSCSKTYSYTGLAVSCSARKCNSAGSCALQVVAGSCNTGKSSNDFTCFKQRCRSEATGGGTCSTSVRNGVTCSAVSGRPCADPKCNTNGQCALSPKNLGATCVDATQGTSSFCNPLQCDAGGSCRFNPAVTEDTPNCLAPPDSNAAVCITSACKSGSCRDTSNVIANNNTKVCKGLSPNEDSCHGYFCLYRSADIHNHLGTCVSQPNPTRLGGECSIPNNPDSDLDQKCYELKCAVDGTCTRNFYNSGTFCGYPPNTVVTNGFACSKYVCDGTGHCNTGNPIQVPNGDQCAGQVPCPWYEPGCNGECQQFICQSGQCVVDNYKEGQNCTYIKPQTARAAVEVGECGQGKCLAGYCTVVNTQNGTSCGNRTKYGDLCYGDYCDGSGSCVHTERKSCVGAIPLPNVCFDATCEAATGECVLVSNGVVDCSCITDCAACTAAFSYNPNSSGRKLGCYWCTGNANTGPACYNRHLPTGENFPAPSGKGSCYTDDSPCGGGGGLTGGAIAGIVVGVVGLSSLLALIFALGALLVRYFSTAGTPPASASLTDLAFDRDVKNCAIYQGADLGGVSALYAEPKFITA